MNHIKKLPKEVILKIAAGEVVERPASVVKELIENSLDAKADSITIEIINAGKDLIKVSDNGLGISKEDLPLAIERHATSKINDEEDLNKIRSLGFRGEALASIAAVSRLTIISKKSESLYGAKLTYEDKNVIIQDASANNGTTVIVKDLFYNTPARKKFLKSNAVEKSHIYNVVFRYAFSYPQVRFKLISDGEILIDKPQVKDLYEASLYLFPKEIYKNIVPFTYSDEKVKIEALLGKPTIARKDSEYMIFFVNHRFIKSDLLNKAVTDAYNTMLFLDRKPVIVMNLEINPEEINVNVHPQKTEIKFNKEQEVYLSVFEAIQQAIKSNNLIEEKTDKTQQVKLVNQQQEHKPQKEFKPKYDLTATSQTYLKEPQSKYESNRIKDQFRILGQVHKTYIIAESKKGFVIIDQHAAAERINFEKLNRQFNLGNINSQKLINPILIKYNKPEFEIVSQNLDKVKRFGFEIEPFGEEEFIVRTIPSIYDFLEEKDLKELIVSIAKEFRIRESQDIINERVIFTMACRRSIKAGKEMSIQEAYNLLEELFKCEKPYTCPHGRPTIIELDEKEIEKMFKRSL
ncbi:MAG: mismatch repair protein MutL [Candidatus Woesearchaeota archaeon]|nr:mismatch repair protein MutL [Candidatus Woesearchaeota archaeon]